MNISQLAKNIDCKNLLQCFFGLNSSDVEVFKALFKASRIEDLSNMLGKSENAVYKSLQKLMLCGLVYREKRTLQEGGYYYEYAPIPKSELVRLIDEKLGELCKKVRIILAEIENDSSSWL